MRGWRVALGVTVLALGLSACTTAIDGTAIPGGGSVSGARGTGLTGSWHGHILGDYHEYDVDVQLSDTAGKLSGQAIYSNGLSCPGAWTQQGRTATVIQLTERTPGSPCTPDAAIVLTVLDQRHLGYGATSRYTPRNPTGTLIRDGNQ